ncbi:exocyst complex component EXO84B-like isoform X1 [Rosa rugosa]|uniref:exocyst complex component EXO84B-like isoform X1 n=1 Tax=Rosa rugosa TaxID=74645 RepID=UPI002B40CFA7|nr:exocyst complex component EXO84B-like isoform X1 [Rosa rugosa]
MESSSTSSRFRFRDLPEMENSTQSDTASDASSVVSSDRDDDSDLQSMTARGIKHLCSELLELKAASNGDFHRHIFANYSSFIRVFEEVGRVERELLQLRNHVSTQKRLVNDLVDGIYSKVLSKESMDSVIEESEWDEPLLISELEAHANDVLETLDILLSENRIDEALAILELEDENFQRMQFEEDCPLDELRLFDSAISERKGLLTQQLTMLAENPRISAAELQKALVGLCRLGDSHLATNLLLKYYHSRIASGIHKLKASKSLLDRVYIRELSKFVFSKISQAARSFVMLYGETSPYAPEVVKWTRQETKVFAACFDEYVKSISEISGGLSTAVEAMQFAISFCCLLETQRLVLQPYLIKHIRPCMEDVLNIHLDHFTKVIGIFTATDTWVLGRYLVSGIINEWCSSMVVGQQPEYCLLTNSGRKFVTLLQAITVDVSPLLALEIEGSILSGLMNLFKKYIDILERAINCETTVTEKSSSRINLAESVQQQVSILANLSSLEQLFSNMVRSIFKGASDTNSELRKSHPGGYQQKEIDSCIFFIQEASLGLRSLFCEQFINKVMSLKTSYKLPEICIDGQGESCIFDGGMPSLTFQVLFLELRKLEKLSEDNVFEVDWLIELLGEIIEAVFVWISNNKEFRDINKENMTEDHPLAFKQQFILDVQFLVEITRYGGYFSSNPLFLMNLMKSAFVSAGLDPRRDVNDDAWAIDSAAETIQKLLEIEKEQEHVSEEEAEEQPNNEADSFQDDANSSEEDAVATDKPEVACNAESISLNTEECTDQPKNETGFFQADASSCLEGSAEPEEHKVASYDPEVSFNAESASMNTAHSFQEDDTSSLEDYVELEEGAVVSYDQEVDFNAETTSSLEAEPSESKYATDTSENDAASPSEDHMQLEEDETARYNPQVNAETVSLNTESCAPGLSANFPDVDGNSTYRSTTNVTDTSLESQDSGLESVSNKPVDVLEIIEEINVPTAVLPIHNTDQASEMKVPDEEGSHIQSEASELVMNNP